MDWVLMQKREDGIPCIVGAGNATRALKTGMVVEVNADEGRVTVLEGSAGGA